jgi:hypothetical protein
MALTSITDSITDNVIDALELIDDEDGYDFTPGVVELERSIMIVNDRYPYISVSGPAANVEFAAATRTDIHTLSYIVSYIDLIDDTDTDDDPLPKQAANVVANIHKAMMTDHTRGGKAITTRLREYGYINYDSDTGVHFEVYAAYEVEAHIDTFDLTAQG